MGVSACVGFGVFYCVTAVLQSIGWMAVVGIIFLIEAVVCAWIEHKSVVAVNEEIRRILKAFDSL